jgi:hypothetical protein
LPGSWRGGRHAASAEEEEQENGRGVSSRHSDPSDGYAIAARLKQVSRGALQLNMGTLYPAVL